MVFVDHKGYAFDKIMADVGTLYVLHAWLARRRFQVVRGRDLVIHIGGNGEFAGTVFRVCRKLVKARDAVGGNAYDRRSGGIELVFLLGEGVSLKITAAGVGRWIK